MYISVAMCMEKLPSIPQLEMQEWCFDLKSENSAEKSREKIMSAPFNVNPCPIIILC